MQVFSEVSLWAPRGCSVTKFSFGTTRVVAFIVLGQFFSPQSCDLGLAEIYSQGNIRPLSPLVETLCSLWALFHPSIRVNTLILP